MAPRPAYPESRFERREVEGKRHLAGHSAPDALHEERAARGAAAALGFFSYRCDNNSRLAILFFLVKYPQHDVESATCLCANRKHNLLLQNVSMIIFIILYIFGVFITFIMCIDYL